MNTTATERRVLEWPMHRPTDELIAERMLAAALYNYHHIRTTPREGRPFRMAIWQDLTEAQRAFLIDWAIPQALQAIWKGQR